MTLIIQELERFVVRLQRRIDKLESISRRLSHVRLAIFLVAVFATYMVFDKYPPVWGWVAAAVGIVVFAVAVILHSRFLASIVRHRYYSQIKRTHIARIKRDWSAIRLPPVADARQEHPFARDLNLLGERSLHHLLDTSFTSEGSELLATWLTCETADQSTIAARQSAIRELVPMSRFRDRLTLISALATRDACSRWNGSTILRWLHNSADLGRIKVVLVILSSIALLTALLLIANLLGQTGTWWMLSLTLYAAIYLTNSKLYSHLFDEAEHLYFEINRYRPILEYLEQYPFRKGGSLESLAAALQTEGDRPSRYLKNLLWLSLAASTQKNEVVRLVLNVVCPWDLFFTYRLAVYKRRLAERLPKWLGSVNEFEAATSLANYASLNADTTFPEIIGPNSGVEGSGSFRTAGIGHPLIPQDDRVVNDFNAAEVGRIALITGSNMSGKSTFLRTLGVNLCLAFAGGPVNAESFATPVFRLFTCINVADSVNDGISYFYAEVKRLRRLMDELETDATYPLFFLVDEIFRGTNNRERFIGSRALLLEMVQQNGFGVVSTHDLELTDLENIDARIKNYHFREHIDEGQMVFDYKLRSGPCPTTNALTIMQYEGLPVNGDDVKTRNR